MMVPPAGDAKPDRPYAIDTAGKSAAHVASGRHGLIAHTCFLVHMSYPDACGTIESALFFLFFFVSE